MLALGDFGKLRRYALWEAKWLQIASAGIASYADVLRLVTSLRMSAWEATAGIAWDRASRSPNMAGRTNFVFQDSTIQR